MSFDWGVSSEMLEEEVKKEEAAQAKRGIPESGIYPAVVKKAYLSRSQGGALGFNLELAELDGNPIDGEGRTFYYTGWIKSGDAKGNKTTWTRKIKDEKTGEETTVEVLLPSWFQVEHILAIAGKKLEELQPQDATIERFGQQENVKIMPELEGTKTKIVVQQYENDHNNEVTIKYDILDFLKPDGSAVGSGRDEAKWAKYLERNPIKLLKKKQEKKTGLSPEEQSAVNKW